MAGMGVPPDQIQAYFSLRASQTSPDLVAQNIRAFRAQGKELGMQTINQNMMWGGPLGSRISDVVKGTKEGLLQLQTLWLTPLLAVRVLCQTWPQRRMKSLSMAAPNQKT